MIPGPKKLPVIGSCHDDDNDDDDDDEELVQLRSYY